MVVDDAVTLTQSLPGLGSPCSGGLAWLGAPSAGTELPVQASLLAAPATVALVVISKVGSAAFTARPPLLGCSQTTTPVASAQTQPEPLALTKLSPLRPSTTRSGPVAERGPPLLTTMVETMFDPRATGFGLLVLDSRRSAPSRRTVTATDPLLLLLIGSGVALLMLALLVKLLPPAATAVLSGAMAVISMLSVAPTGRLARVQVTVAPPVQAQLGPLAETKVQPAGRVSVTTALVAATGPLLRGWIWKLTLPPAVAGWAEVTVFCAMRTSAPALTCTLASAVLSLVSGSGTPPAAGATVALLVMVPPTAVTVPTSVTGGIAAPTACGPGRLQLTTPAAWLQAQPLPAAET